MLFPRWPVRSADSIHHWLSLLNKHPLIPLGHSNSVQTKHRPSLAYKSMFLQEKERRCCRKVPNRPTAHPTQTSAPLHKSHLTRWTPSNRCISDGYSDNESWRHGWLMAAKQKHNNSGIIHAVYACMSLQIGSVHTFFVPCSPLWWPVTSWTGFNSQEAYAQARTRTGCSQTAHSMMHFLGDEAMCYSWALG